MFTAVGYGRLGTGATGSLEATEGTKHLGMNRFEDYASALRDLPAFGLAPAGATTLMWDFDNALAANDAMGLFLHRPDLGLGAQESNPAQGDSGGPLFLGDRIAGIVSYSDGGVSPPDINTDIDRGFGEFGIATRAGAFADYIREQTASPADLVLDLRYQLVGLNGRRDKVIVTARRVGDNLELAVRVPGSTTRYDGVYFSGPLASVRSLTLRGSDDAEIFLLDQDLGVPVAIQGRGFHDTAYLSGKPRAAALRQLRFDGGAGRDTLVVQADTHFTLAAQQVLAEQFAQITLASVEVAQLRGGPSANHFTLTGWRGQAYLDGAGGPDTLSVQVSRSAAQVQAQRLADAGVVRLLYRDGARGRVSWAGIETLCFSP
ncbi:MAG: trypsin-like serine protease [Gemmataceae bacterium]